jgi:CubicO group peptidase (beta-lactamase class C family)
MSRNRLENWLAVGVGGVGAVLTAALGLVGYTIVTGPLHPEPDRLPSIARFPPSQEWADAVGPGRQILLHALVDQNLPGLSVAVGVDGDIVWAEGFGWADLEKQVPVAPETRFRIGTASMALTSAAVGLLLERNRLALDEKIQTYVPEIPEKDWPVTLHQLMGHVAGVADDGGDEGPLFTQHCERPADALQFLSGYERELLFEPGTHYYESSYGWIMVSAAVEAAAREPFLMFMHEQVFEPLGMGATIPESAAEPIADWATPYFPRLAAEPRFGLHLMRPLDYSCYAGSSVFLSTPSDLVRFGMAINGGKLLQQATVHVLQTPQRLPSGQETGYGLGWDVENVVLAGKPTRWAGHEGELLGGRVVSLITFPEHGIAVAVASNISYADTSSLAVIIAQAFAQQGRSPARR